MNKDDYLGKLISQTNEDCCSNDFINDVMIGCYKYEAKKARISKYRKYALSSLPILLLIIALFIPGISEFVFNLLNNITLKGILEYYVISSVIMLSSFYIILFDKIYKFIKLRVLQSV